MADRSDGANVQLCERLKTLGYSQCSIVRMYGEEFDLISNPMPEGNGFAVEAVSRKSGSTRKLLIPLSIVQMITNDLAAKGSRAA